MPVCGQILPSDISAETCNMSPRWSRSNEEHGGWGGLKKAGRVVTLAPGHEDYTGVSDQEIFNVIKGWRDGSAA